MLMKDYKEINTIYEDIKNLNIQGATNVAIATFEGMKKYISISNVVKPEDFFSEFFEVGRKLSNARSNEPLAKNGVKFVKYFFGQRNPDLPDLNTMKRDLLSLCDEYLDIISNAKRDLVQNNKGRFLNYDKVFTHCHSSTAVAFIKAISKGDQNFEAVCTETRPLYQGRITAKNLINAGIKTTMIVDSASESFIINRGSVPIDIVFIGCDQITLEGHTINKIGSWGIGASAYYGGKPMYVVTPFLKIDVSSKRDNIEIEVREDRELWEEAPEELDMYNPAFEIVDSRLIAGYITEFGVIKPEEVGSIAKEKYPWLYID